MTKLYSVILLMFLTTIGALQAQTSVTSVDQTYTQDFNTLAYSGTTNSFSLSNWTINKDTYNGNDGGLGSGTIYSYGAAGTTERALGSLNSGSNPKLYFGTSFKNESGASIGKISVSYTGEQWRNGTKNVLGAGTLLPDSLVFQYSLNATSAADSNATWTSVDALTFVTPTLAATESKLDGNAAANKAALSAELGISLTAGQTIVIRWANERSTSSTVVGSRHGLAIDDLTVTFGEGGEVPVDSCDFDLDAAPVITHFENDLESFYVQYSPVEGAKGYLILLDFFNPYVDEPADYEDYPEDGVTYEEGEELGYNYVLGVTTETEFEFIGLDAEEGYYVRVIPIYECEESPIYGNFDEKYFNTVEDECNGAMLIFPTSIGVEVSGVSATVNITPVADAIGYLVFIDDADEVIAAGESYEWGWPEDGEEYVSGGTLGQSSIAYVGSNTTVSIDNLEEDKLYYVSVHPIFDCDGDVVYGYFAENEIETSLPTIIKNKAISNVLIYPNPVSGNVLNVRLDAATQGKANVQIFNVLGAQVFGAQQSISSNTQLRLPNALPAGRYTLRIEQDGAAQIGSFIVVR